MKKTKLSVFLIIFAVLIFTIGGCNRDSNQFNDNYDQFKKSYLSATEFIEKDNNLEKALATIDYNQMDIEMEKMKKALDAMNNLLKTDREKGIYSNVTGYYQEAEYILYASKNFKNLTVDEKRRLLMTVISIERNREHIIKGEV